MAAELEAPTDKLTGIPFCLLPSETGWIDPNHQIFHSDEPELQTVGGQAIRHGRIQDVDIVDHVVFHQRYGWIKIPSTPHEQFNYLGFIIADYIPPFGIDVRRRNPWVRRLSEEEVVQLRSNEIRIGSNAILGQFFAEYAAEQDLSNSSAVDEFLHTAAFDETLNTADRARRRAVAGWLLKEALIQALDPMRHTFKKAKLMGSVAVKNFDQLPYVMSSKVGPRDRDKFMKKQWSKLAKEALQTEVAGIAEMNELEQVA